MIDRHVSSLATWLSKPIGFPATVFTVTVGLAAGFVLSFNDHWALVFNLALSIGAILFSGIILVAGAKDTGAIQAKLDELIRAVDKADDHLIGIDQRSSEELEEMRAHYVSSPAA
jgi:low affinity Fe/Cu permease